jgi:DNA-binding SARP family transcriptional activator
MDVRLLGNVEIHPAGALPRAGERCVLATLAFNPGRRVHVDVLIEHLWGEEPPANAEHTIASYVRAVRRAVERAGGRRDWLRNHRPGAYQLDIEPDLVDYHRFTALVATARARTGEPAAAIAAYEEALALRRGEALADVTGQWARDRAYAVEQEYLGAVCELYEQQLATGAFAAVATSALHLISEVDPSDRLILLAIRGLAGSGRHAAIEDFLTRAAQRMWEAAGARPSAEVWAIARDLIARPGAQFASPVAGPATRTPPRAARGVTMRADHNGRVYQAAGDQYIVES